jgi:hypothetical protein
MNRVQPPARDYVPRRSGEIAASHLKAYLFFRHNTYDAGEGCFVPSNVIFDAKKVTPVTYEFYEWKRRCLFPIGRGRAFSGSTATCCFFAGAQAALHFSLQILAKAFRNDARSG